MRRRILIYRKWGGLGDILVHRGIFKDVQEHYNAPVDFACPTQYHDVVKDHPYINEVVDAWRCEQYAYPLWFDTSTICARNEVAHLKDKLPYPSRFDVWAAGCGVKSKDRDPHFRFTDQEHERAKQFLEGVGCVFCPVSAHFKKDLSPRQRETLFSLLDKEGLRPKVLHSADLGLPAFPQLTVREWMALIYNAPLVVTVDTAAICMAGLSRVPAVAMFWVHPGEAICKYYPTATVVQSRNAKEVDLSKVVRKAVEASK